MNRPGDHGFNIDVHHRGRELLGDFRHGVAGKGILGESRCRCEKSRKDQNGCYKRFGCSEKL